MNGVYLHGGDDLTFAVRSGWIALSIPDPEDAELRAIAWAVEAIDALGDPDAPARVARYIAQRYGVADQ